ncbi:uncharacterized protein [Typha angustifolia]|uniref:uncharacterized protein n=1 Tax=Typha angustifolia TaxID=59011 RepID=UPI003C2C8463
MGDRTQHEISLLEELDLVQKSKEFPEAASRSGNVFCHWKWKVLDCFHGDSSRVRRSPYVVWLQVQQISGLPPVMEGRVLVVGWKTKGCKGEHTLPVHVCEGAATFDEIFLHSCNTDIRSILRSFTIWVSLDDSPACDLGTFQVDLSEFMEVNSLNPKFGGKTMSFVLGGVANGGRLSLSVYCRLMEEEAHDLFAEEQSKTKCFSCLPDLACLKRRHPTVSARRDRSLRSDHGFITIENLNDEFQMDDEDGGFITIEKGAISSRSWLPPSDSLPTTDDENSEPVDEKTCFVMELNENFDVDGVEDEFLNLLEEKTWKGSEVEPWRKGMEGSLSLTLDLSLDLDLDLDLDSLIKEAEIELVKAAQVWRSRVGGALLEKEEYEELMKRWRAKENSSSGSL